MVTNSDVKTHSVTLNFLTVTSDLLYPNQAKLKVGPHAKNQGQTVRPWEYLLTDGQTDGQTDGHYQIYCFPASRSIKIGPLYGKRTWKWQTLLHKLWAGCLHINRLFFKKNDYYSVIFWVRSIILDLTQNLNLTRE